MYELRPSVQGASGDGQRVVRGPVDHPNERWRAGHVSDAPGFATSDSCPANPQGRCPASGDRVAPAPGLDHRARPVLRRPYLEPPAALRRGRDGRGPDGAHRVSSSDSLAEGSGRRLPTRAGCEARLLREDDGAVRVPSCEFCGGGSAPERGYPPAAVDRCHASSTGHRAVAVPHAAGRAASPSCRRCRGQLGSGAEDCRGTRSSATPASTDATDAAFGSGLRGRRLRTPAGPPLVRR